MVGNCSGYRLEGRSWSGSFPARLNRRHRHWQRSAEIVFLILLIAAWLFLWAGRASASTACPRGQRTNSVGQCVLIIKGIVCGRLFCNLTLDVGQQ